MAAKAQALQEKMAAMKKLLAQSKKMPLKKASEPPGGETKALEEEGAEATADAGWVRGAHLFKYRQAGSQGGDIVKAGPTVEAEEVQAKLHGGETKADREEKAERSAGASKEDPAEPPGGDNEARREDKDKDKGDTDSSDSSDSESTLPLAGSAVEDDAAVQPSKKLKQTEMPERWDSINPGEGLPTQVSIN